MKKILRLKFLIIPLLLTTLVACGGGGDAPQSTTTPPPPTTTPPVTNPPATITGSISGVVQDAKTKLPVEGLTVTAKGVVVTTSSTGSYVLAGVETDARIIVTIKGSGYAEQSKIVSLTKQGQTVDLSVSILPVDLTQAFEPDLAADLSMAGSPARVQLTAGALIQEDGSAPSGMATINLTVIDPTTDIELMPGDMQTNTTGGTLAQIESFGAITATFTDASGNDLNLAAGSPAIIRIPVASNTLNPPATIPLFFYNKETGLWVEEGSATLDPTQQFYEGSVTHFSTWNADKVFERVTINGCVEDSLGARIEDVRIYSSGNDYSGRAYAYTDAAGNFSVFAKSNASVSVFGRKLYQKTNSVDVATATSDITLANCLVLEEISAGAGDGGGILTLSGDGAARLGVSQAVFNDIINIYSAFDSLYLSGSEDEDILNPVIGQVDEDNTAAILAVGDMTDKTIFLYLTVNGQTSVLICTTTDVTGSCGTGFVTVDMDNRSISFTNAVLVVSVINNAGTAVEQLDTVVNGTLTWRDYDYFGIGLL